MRRVEIEIVARTLGMSEEAIARYDAVALAFGPKTTLPNSAVYDAAWEVRLGYLKRGEAFPPKSAMVWGLRIWLVLVQSGISAAPAMIRDVAQELWEAVCDVRAE